MVSTKQSKTSKLSSQVLQCAWFHYGNLGRLSAVFQSTMSTLWTFFTFNLHEIQLWINSIHPKSFLESRNLGVFESSNLLAAPNAFLCSPTAKVTLKLSTWKLQLGTKEDSAVTDLLRLSSRVSKVCTHSVNYKPSKSPKSDCFVTVLWVIVSHD